MFSQLRYLLSDVVFWIRSHPVRAGLAVLLTAAVVAGVVLGIGALAGGDDERAEAPAPQVFVRTEAVPEAAAELGFPAFATSNTTRVAAPDAVATAAGVALATFPNAGGVEGPDAVTLVPSEDWAAGIAAASLVAAPVGAPILLSEGGELPDLTGDALVALSPQGAAVTGNRQVFAVGDAPQPEATRSQQIEGANAAEVAAEVARLRARLVEEDPEHLLVASSDDPAYAMPAAAWAARSGDPVLFAQLDSVPDATLELIEEYEDVPVYLLGPEAVISADVQRQIRQASNSQVRRAGQEDNPVANAVEFARYVDGTFGWNINDPGHGFVVANAGRPADAGAAAALSGTGSWGPLLLTDEAATPPAELEGYLLDLKPGYSDDPTRAVYNHIWIVGDEEAISVDFQVELDAVAEVAPVRSGEGTATLGPGAPEAEEPDRGNANQADDDR